MVVAYQTPTPVGSLSLVHTNCCCPLDCVLQTVSFRLCPLDCAFQTVSFRLCPLDCVTLPSKEPPLPSTPSLWKWMALSTTVTRWSLLRSWVLILKDLRNLLPSFMFILSITLPNLFIPDVLFPALISTLIR